MDKKAYLIVIEAAQQNYSAYCPDVPGCIATGKTVEITIEKMRSALKFHLEGNTGIIPQAKGLKYYLDNGQIQLSENCLFTEMKLF
jgi:predicted RNase H-like HicB family nuclease